MGMVAIYKYLQILLNQVNNKLKYLHVYIIIYGINFSINKNMKLYERIFITLLKGGLKVALKYWFRDSFKAALRYWLKDGLKID